MKKTQLFYNRAFAKPLSVAAAVALAASMTPVAFAATPEGATDVAFSNVTITGLQAGDTVSAWRIADAYVTANNEIEYEFAQGLPEAYDSVDELKAITSDGTAFTAGTAMQNAAAAIAKAFANTEADKTAKASGDNATLTLDSGYYLIRVTSTSGNAKVYQNMVVDVTPQAGNDGKYVEHANQSLAVKSSQVNVTKKVGTEAGSKTDAYQVGDTVPFQISTAVPSYPKDATNVTFVVGDVPTTGLKIDTSSITVEGATVGDYTLTPVGDGFTITFTDSFVRANGGKDVTVKYNAKITKDAFSTADSLTSNTASVTFNPNPYTDITVERDDIAEVQTYGYVFAKVDENAAALEGATFTLYDESSNVIKDENGVAITSTSTKVGDKAYVYFSGLKAGKYVAKETTTPAGYSATQVEFEVSEDTATADNPATANIVENNYLVNATDVIDNKAPALPVTGGAGTVGMTVVGVVFIGGAAYLLTRNRRKGEQE